jgi:DNA-directed RNA polymerase subunit N (RpoN/RPB10)
MATNTTAHMLLPIRCYTCGHTLGTVNNEREYIRRVYVNKEHPKEVLDDLTSNFCCRLQLQSMPVSNERIQAVLEEMEYDETHPKQKPKELPEPEVPRLGNWRNTSTGQPVNLEKYEPLRHPYRLAKIREAEQIPKEDTTLIVQPEEVTEEEMEEEKPRRKSNPKPRKSKSAEKEPKKSPKPRKSKSVEKEEPKKKSSPKPKKTPEKEEPKKSRKSKSLEKEVVPTKKPRKSSSLDKLPEKSLTTVKINKKNYVVVDEASAKIIKDKNLEKLTVAQLKDFISSNNLQKPKAKDTKSDIIEIIKTIY